MSSWLNFNESLNNIKGQISTFASNVLADEEGGDPTSTSNEELQQACRQKDLEIERLRKVNEDLQTSIGISGQRNGEPEDISWDWTTPEPTTENPQENISHLKETIKILQNEKNDLINQLEQLDSEHQQNLIELMGIRENLQDENNDLKEKNSKLKHQNKTLLTAEEKLKKELQDKQATSTNENIIKANQELNKKLEEATKELSVLKSTHSTLKKTLADTQKSTEKELAELTNSFKKSEAENKIISSELQKANEFVRAAELKSQEDAENCQKLAFILESYEKQVSSLKTELANNQELQKQPESEKTNGDIETQQKESLHNTYVNIITDNIKRYMDSELLLTDPKQEASEDPHIAEFSRQVQNIFKILLEFKDKCESLEKQLIEASNEKTKILNDKYNEIEKLIQNSEMLSQEVLKKAETIKELETEVTSLIASNDVLLSELDSYKTSGLQTISESNEDNMVLLETDLENANKRIKELEEIIDSPSKTTSASNDTSNASLESKINQKQNDYQELLNSFDDLKIDYEEMTYKLNDASEKLSDLETENEDLKSHLEKVKTEFENTDYQLSEANFALDSLKEELETIKLNTETLRQENKELKLQNMNSIDLKSEFNEVKEKWLVEENRRKELETQVKILTEKQQSSKMTETSLKLQYDTLNKEYFTLADAKNSLEQSLANVKESLIEYEANYTELLQKYDSVLLRCEELNTSIHEKEQEILRLKQLEEHSEKLEKAADLQLHADALKLLQEKDLEVANLNLQLEQHKLQIEQLQPLISTKDDELLQLQQQIKKLKEEQQSSATQENEKLQAALKQSEENAILLQKQLQELANSRNELISMITIKHQESLNYHNEIQRLSEILKGEAQKHMQLEAKLVQASGASDEIAKKNEEIDKLSDEVSFLKEKCDILTKNLLEEQSKLQQFVAEKSGPSDKELSLVKQVERLQSHLMELEDHYTQELLLAEHKNADLQAKVTDLEQREKNSSTMYTSVSIRANQQVETLQNQLQMVTNQREELRKKISDAEDLHTKQAAALANLQFVLEQFQKDKEKDVQKETERIRRQINAEKRVQDELKKEIDNLKSQLEESKLGLQAASRLSDQLELQKKQNSGLKEEVSQLQQKLSKSQQTIYDLTSQTDGKIDKSLIKSLIVGFLSSGNTNNWNKDQTQVLKLIATVLDFNQQDHDKLNKQQQGSWLGSILSPQPSATNISHESLSQAFVRFLENESKPRIVPSLLGEQSSRPSTSTESSKRTTPRASPSPIVLNEVVLPTFADFGQSRNSSSILKDVLKDNNG